MTEAASIPRDESPALFVAFARSSRLAAGTLSQVAIAAKQALERDPTASVLVFNGDTGEVVDLDLRGEAQDVAARLAPPPAPAPKRGRPRLGVVAREVTLLPRHWEWLALQPGGASVTLRKLVETARKANGEAERARTRRDAAYRFMAAIAGDYPGFEAASRALFADDPDQFRRSISGWPPDIRDQTLRFLGGEPAAP